MVESYSSLDWEGHLGHCSEHHLNNDCHYTYLIGCVVCRLFRGTWHRAGASGMLGGCPHPPPL